MTGHDCRHGGDGNDVMMTECAVDLFDDFCFSEGSGKVHVLKLERRGENGAEHY